MRVFIAAIGGSDGYLNISDTVEPWFVSLGGKDAALARAWLHAPEFGVRHLAESIVTKLNQGEDLWGRLSFPLFDAVLRRFPAQDGEPPCCWQPTKQIRDGESPIRSTLPNCAPAR